MGSDLGLDYVDLFLIHWPCAFKLDAANERNAFPQTPAGITMDDDAHYVDTWLKLEELVKKGDKIKAIGVGNFNEYQLKKVLEKASVVPAMNQIELHAYRNMSHMVKLCHDNKIQVTAYSPLGAPARPDGLKKGQAVLMEDPVVVEIAKKHNIVCIPKSVTPARIVANSEIFDFELAAADMSAINELNKDLKYVHPDRFEPSKFFPWAPNYSE